MSRVVRRLVLVTGTPKYMLHSDPAESNIPAPRQPMSSCWIWCGDTDHVGIQIPYAWQPSIGPSRVPSSSQSSMRNRPAGVVRRVVYAIGMAMVGVF